MVRYETLILAVPEITAAESSALERDVEKVVKSTKGDVISFERWGKHRLAYPVGDNEYGVYFLVRFTSEDLPKYNQDVRSYFLVKCANFVVRHVTVRLNPKVGLEYSRPQSVDEVPVKNVDSFLKENKMDGLLKNAPRHRTEDGQEDHDTTEEDFA